MSRALLLSGCFAAEEMFMPHRRLLRRGPRVGQTFKVDMVGFMTSDTRCRVHRGLIYKNAAAS